MTTSKYHPQSKPSVSLPLAPSGTCGASSLPEGAMGCVAFHIGFLKKESACCESLSHASGVPAPFHKGAFGRTIDTGRVREVTNRRKLSCALTAAARRLWQGSLFCARYRYRAGQGSNDTQKAIVRNDSGGTPLFHKGAFFVPSWGRGKQMFLQ